MEEDKIMDGSIIINLTTRTPPSRYHNQSENDTQYSNCILFKKFQTDKSVSTSHNNEYLIHKLHEAMNSELS